MGLQSGVKAASGRGAHLWSTCDSVNSKLSTDIFKKSQLEKNTTVNTDDRMNLNGRTDI